MKPSKYLEAFKNVDMSSLTHQLIGSTLLVERVPHEEKKTAGGIIMPTDVTSRQVNTMAADLPTFVHVVSVGRGYYNEETGADVPLNVEAGDIILIGALSIKWFSLLEIDGYEPYSIGLAREEDIQLRFKGLKGYQAYFSALNGRLKEQVSALPSSIL